MGSGVGFSTWIVTGKPMHWEGGKIVSMSIYIGTVFLIDEVWYVIWLVVTAGSMAVVEMKCDSLSLFGAPRLAATLRCNHLFSHMSSLL